YSSSDSEIEPISLMDIFRKIFEESGNNEAIESESVTHLRPNNINKEIELEPKKQKTKQYITRDLVKEVLEAYQTRVLPGEKLIYNDINVLDFIYLTNEMKKSPLSIGIINLHNADCTKFLSGDFKKYIAQQLQDPKIKSIKFSNGNIIDKLHVNCDEEVLKFLDKFDNVTDLKSLGERLDEN
ncbi:24683_t:CDS:2, partial [Gigaspora rosea]